MSRPIGGRGKRAPYETTHLRVPLPIKPQLEEMIEAYRRAVLDGQSDLEPAVPPLEQTLDFAEKLVRGKTSKINTIRKLLTFIYKEDVNGFMTIDK